MRGRAVFLVATLALACSKREDDAGSPGAPQGPVLARGRGIAVTEADFRAKLAEQSPFARAYDGTMERKKELLETVIRFELLAKEAEEQGLDRDPEVRAAARRIMVQKLLRKRLDEKDGTPGAPAAREQRARLLEEHVRELRERAGVTVDLPALERVDLGEVASPGLRGHSTTDGRPAVPPPAR
jgi:peptidyl-prolyl cis-trans isomerase C